MINSSESVTLSGMQSLSSRSNSGNFLRSPKKWCVWTRIISGAGDVINNVKLIPPSVSPRELIL